MSDPKPGEQDERSLDDQANLHSEWIARNVKGCPTVENIAGSGSGELLDREEYQKLIDRIGTGTIDLVVCEDLVESFDGCMPI